MTSPSGCGLMRMVRKIVVSEFVTLDGVMEDPGGAEGTSFGGWAFKAERGEAGNRFKFEELMAADAQLLGRKTYEGFAAAWPSMTDDQGFAEKMNSMPKYVVSSTLSEPAWNATVIGLEDIEDLEGNILVAGSGQLVQTLFEHHLVDEVRLVLYPIAVGSGKKLFDVPAELTLTSAEQSDQVVLLTYARR
jgi:dihydrofolate reductase